SIPNVSPTSIPPRRWPRSTAASSPCPTKANTGPNGAELDRERTFTMRCLIAAAALAASSMTLVSPAPAQTVAAAAPRVERTAKMAFGGLYEIVHNPRDGRLYVAAVGPRGSTEARVLALDPETLAIEGEIVVNDGPLYGLGLDARAQLLYGTA